MSNGKEQDNCKEIIYSNEFADYIIQPVINSFYAEEGFVPDCVQVINENFRIIHVKITDSKPLGIRTFGYSALPLCYGLLDTSSMESSGVIRLRRQPFLNLLGNDVIIGIIDTGIDYNHKVFKNADNTTRILNIWDQTQQEGQPPEGFMYGLEYSMDMINLLIQGENNPNELPDTTDENGHGTFLAGIAAGGIDSENDFTGVAPMADIVVVKLKEAKKHLKEYYKIKADSICYQENDIILALEYMRTIRRRYRKPVAICIGVGSNMGDHESGTYLSEYMNRLADSIGETVVVAAGNEGNTGHHFLGRIGKGRAFQEVELKVGPDELGFTMELWASAPYSYSVSIISPRGEYIARIPTSFNKSVVIPLLLEQTVIYVDYIIVEPRTGDFLVFLRFQTPTEGIWIIRVYDDIGVGGEYHMWLPMEHFISSETYFISPEPDTTLCDPANTRRTITVSAYNHLNNSIYLDSSRGFTRLGKIKPDIAAPGVDVYGPIPGGGYGRRSGTSIAAAHATGVVGLLFEWGIVEGNYPLMRSIEVNKILIRGSDRSGLYTFPNRQWGFGTLDALNSISSLISTL